MEGRCLCRGRVVRGAEAVVRSRYDEDVHPGNHSSVWGSYWSDGRWGYACCRSLLKNSLCMGSRVQEVVQEAAQQRAAAAANGGAGEAAGDADAEATQLKRKRGDGGADAASLREGVCHGRCGAADAVLCVCPWSGSIRVVRGCEHAVWPGQHCAMWGLSHLWGRRSAFCMVESVAQADLMQFPETTEGFFRPMVFKLVIWIVQGEIYCNVNLPWRC